LNFQLNEDEFWLYIHGDGEEFYLHYDYWPSVPSMHYVKRHEVFLDVVVTKKIEIRDDESGCLEEENYSYFGN